MKNNYFLRLKTKEKKHEDGQKIETGNLKKPNLKSIN